MSASEILATADSSCGQPGSIVPRTVRLEARRARRVLPINAAYSQAEVQALRDKCEEMADDGRALSVLIHAVRTALVGAGLAKGGVWVGRAT